MHGARRLALDGVVRPTSTRTSLRPIWSDGGIELAAGSPVALAAVEQA